MLITRIMKILKILGGLGRARMLKTGMWQSPGPLKDLQAALLYVGHQGHEDFDGSGGLGSASMLKKRMWRSPGPLKALQAALLHAAYEDYEDSGGAGEG